MKAIILSLICIACLSSCTLPTTSGKLPEFDRMASQTQVGMDSVTKKVTKLVKDSSGSFLKKINRDSVTIEIGNTGEKFTLKN